MHARIDYYRLFSRDTLVNVNRPTAQKTGTIGPPRNQARLPAEKAFACCRRPPDGSNEFDVITIDDTTAVSDLLVGRVILTMKRW